MCIISLWYLTMVPNMKTILPAIMEECVRTDRWINRQIETDALGPFLIPWFCYCREGNNKLIFAKTCPSLNKKHFPPCVKRYCSHFAVWNINNFKQSIRLLGAIALLVWWSVVGFVSDTYISYRNPFLNWRKQNYIAIILLAFPLHYDVSPMHDHQKSWKRLKSWLTI